MAGLNAYAGGSYMPPLYLPGASNPQESHPPPPSMTLQDGTFLSDEVQSEMAGANGGMNAGPSQ